MRTSLSTPAKLVRVEPPSEGSHFRIFGPSVELGAPLAEDRQGHGACLSLRQADDPSSRLRSTQP
ncbi:hypothetical protein [Bradyrhizobium paxllaeri]|uniref:hypothetical protein n=1 Tax=Bradyrhizobium paxllaeri TaxID=190148 RepID=UPI0011466CBE